MMTFQTYPTELERREAQAIATRRKIVNGPVVDAPNTLADSASAPWSNAEVQADCPDGKLPNDTIALAFSGGGIRSATFCLGVMQSMARCRLLRKVDILSTVSGGGYIGAFLGRYYDRLRETPTQAPDMVEQALSNSRSKAVSWLRAHGEYIAPAGKSDLNLSFAILIRNLLTLHFCLGTLLLGLYGLANVVRYCVLDNFHALVLFTGGTAWAQLPIGSLVSKTILEPFWSPWFILMELILLLCVLPNAIGYWLASQDEAEAYHPATLAISFILLLASLYAGLARGLNFAALSFAASILIAFCSVELVWHAVRVDNSALGTGGPAVGQLRARTLLSRRLAMWLVVAATVAYLAAIDSAGHAFYERYGKRNDTYLEALAKLGTAGAALLSALRLLGGTLTDLQSQRRKPGWWFSLLFSPTISAVLAVILLVLPLLVLSYVSHLLFDDGIQSARGAAITILALVVSFVIGLPSAIQIINRTSVQSVYAARLARAFMGASNPAQRGDNADDVAPGDDVDTLSNYRPYEAGGPLHLINLCINQTVDVDSLTTARGRQGEIMACSSIGLSLGQFHHAMWVAKPGEEGARDRALRKPHQTIQALGHVPGTRHPLLGADGCPPDSLDVLALRDWIAISGAAVGTGMGRTTSAVLSLLFVLVNLRTGYWWNSGLTALDRGTLPRVPFFRRLLWLLPGLFQTQTRLMAESMAKFRGPWDQLWYLSDGGHFEDLGVYELIRRKVPVIIVVDAGADPLFQFEDVAILQRRVRVDFGAEISSFTESELELMRRSDPKVEEICDALRDDIGVTSGQGGPLDKLPEDAGKEVTGPLLTKHASLLCVKYPSGRGRSRSLLLYIKASLSGDEPTDVWQYRATHDEFPHESTADQFFDEAQWESYRRLGEHVGSKALGLECANGKYCDTLWLSLLQKAVEALPD